MNTQMITKSANRQISFGGKLCKPVLLLMFVSGVSVAESYAITVASNLSEPISEGSQVRLGQWTANAFTTDNAIYALNSVTIQVLDYPGISDHSGNFFVTINADDNGTPGDVIANGALAGTTNPDQSGLHGFAANNVTLDPNTTYWILAGVSSGDAFYIWERTFSEGQTGTWQIGDAAHSYDQGANWELSTASGLLSIAASPVPDGGSAFGSLLASIMLLGFAKGHARRACQC